MTIDSCIDSFITNSLCSTYSIVYCKVKILFYVTMRFLLRRMLFIFLRKGFKDFSFFLNMVFLKNIRRQFY